MAFTLNLVHIKFRQQHYAIRDNYISIKIVIIQMKSLHLDIDTATCNSELQNQKFKLYTKVSYVLCLPGD